MITQADCIYSVTHLHGGNGWAVVQWIDEDYCRMCSFDKVDISNRAYLAWTKFLNVSLVPSDQLNSLSPKVRDLIPPVVLAKLQATTALINSGKLVIRNTRIVPV